MAVDATTRGEAAESVPGRAGRPSVVQRTVGEARAGASRGENTVQICLSGQEHGVAGMWGSQASGAASSRD